MFNFYISNIPLWTGREDGLNKVYTITFRRKHHKKYKKKTDIKAYHYLPQDGQTNRPQKVSNKGYWMREVEHSNKNLKALLQIKKITTPFRRKKKYFKNALLEEKPNIFSS